jgi:hypothetical protein
LLLSSFSLPAAKWAMTMINLGAASATAWVAAYTMQGDPKKAAAEDDVSCTARWLVVALILGNLSTAFVVWAGQTSLLVAAGLYIGWIRAQQGRWISAGLLLALASIKPQFVVLPAVWLLLQGHWRPLFVAGVGAAAMAAWPIALLGPVDLLQSWISAVLQYSEGPYNALGSRMVFGLRSTLSAIGVRAPNLAALALLALALIWRFRQRLQREDVLALLVGLSLLFGFSHSYDLVILAPLVPAVARYVSSKRVESLGAIGLLALITWPTSQFEAIGMPLLSQLRVLALAVALGWLALLSVRHAARSTMPV